MATAIVEVLGDTAMVVPERAVAPPGGDLQFGRVEQPSELRKVENEDIEQVVLIAANEEFNKYAISFQRADVELTAEDGGRSVRVNMKVRATVGIIPAGLEMLDKPMTAAVEDFVHAGYRTDVASILLCESDGTQQEVADEVRRVEAIMERQAQIRESFH